MLFRRAMGVAVAIVLTSSPLLADQFDDDLAAAKGLLLSGNEEAAAMKLDDLETRARQAVALKPQDGHANYILGMAAMYAGDDEIALRALDIAVKVEPKNATFVLGRAELASMQSKSGEGAMLLQRYLEQDPKNVDVLEKLGSLQTESKNYEGARTSFQKAADLKPAEPRYMARVAEACLAQGKSDDAITAYEKALAIDPKYGVALAGLGETYLKSKTYDKALTYFERAAEANGTDFRSLARQVQIHEATGNLKARDAAIAKIDALHKSGRMDGNSFCREQITHDKTTVMAFQYFPKVAVDANAIYGFVVLNDDGKTAAQRVELAVSGLSKSAPAWSLSVDNADGHAVLPTTFKKEPTYEEARQQVVDYLDGKLKAPAQP